MCSHCAAALPVPAPTVQRLSLLEQAMAKPAAPSVPAPALALAEATPQPLPPPASVQRPYTMPPLPLQPRPRRLSRTPWVLAAVLLLALLSALIYEQLQIRGVSLPSLFTTRP
ncbi:MAG: hypothetical protein H7172_00900 [Ferruginibacter sp.]|nr:hypothetical protein [Rhodoferax sp.]